MCYVCDLQWVYAFVYCRPQTCKLQTGCRFACLYNAELITYIHSVWVWCPEIVELSGIGSATNVATQSSFLCHRWLYRLFVAPSWPSPAMKYKTKFVEKPDKDWAASEWVIWGRGKVIPDAYLGCRRCRYKGLVARSGRHQLFLNISNVPRSARSESEQF